LLSRIGLLLGVRFVCSRSPGLVRWRRKFAFKWKHQQQFDVTGPGLVKLRLPPETLDGARPALEDLRLYDDAGAEVPYLIERTRAAGKADQSAKAFQVR